jgi:fatty-acid peroxygenase
MYPFFPATLAKTRTEFEWQGYAIPAEVGLMLDLHGTNHDPRLFADPDRFNPDRFLDTAIDPFNLIPQGGGDHAAGHRCAGEWITIDLMKRATRFLAHRIRYAVPNQKLDIDYQRLPAMLPDGFVMREVKRR